MITAGILRPAERNGAFIWIDTTERFLRFFPGPVPLGYDSKREVQYSFVKTAAKLFSNVEELSDSASSNALSLVLAVFPSFLDQYGRKVLYSALQQLEIVDSANYTKVRSRSCSRYTVTFLGLLLTSFTLDHVRYH